MSENVMIALVAALATVSLISVTALVIVTVQKTRAAAKLVKENIKYASTDPGLVDPAEVTLQKDDILLRTGETLRTAGSDRLHAGKYMVLAGGPERKFTMRVGGFVREYSHGDPIVLTDGDEICAVSQNAILREKIQGEMTNE